MKAGRAGIYARYIKRILDVLLSACALAVLSPVLLIVAVLVRTKLGSPVIFSQERPGKNEKIFKMYKFRSMTDQRDENGELLPDEARLTRFGRILRSTSLDELPELSAFADKLEKATLQTIEEDGIMTGDLAGLVEGERPAPVMMPERIVSRLACSSLSAKASSAGSLSSWPRFFSAPVHAKIVAIGLVEVCSPLR